MPDSLEAAALNGSLFTFQDSLPSPSRSASSSSPQNTDDELGSDLEDDNDDGPSTAQSSILGRRGDTSGRGAPRVRSPPVEHDGPQTGPKGVIEDRRAANTHAKQERERQVAEQLAEANRRALVGLTIDEEDKLRRKEKQQDDEKEDEELAEWRRRRKAQLVGDRDPQDEDELPDRSDWDAIRRESVKRGGLRELGAEGFVDAVEKPGWVAVLIYEPGIPRCTSLLASMLHLSLNLPSSLPVPVSLYRALATSLSFSLLPPTSQTHATVTSAYHDDDEDDVPKGRPDPDVLPTMLVYKDGELEHNWVRVDWDVKEDGVEGLFRRVGILPSVHKIGINRQDRHLLDVDDDD
ncbi:hypothetical protein I316_04712 [Kwoniella heveanensis BCC8398]|uniref:Phosducin domain-containing protein n=1 Tax=Kwoniella heveanensis BCC8398 TaxID=1296120 RepID=A0A1B9GRP0_9TREE|nr:hypothetical protein I316_04712 [Kwoniella heveanensis BCC8398]